MFYLRRFFLPEIPPATGLSGGSFARGRRNEGWRSISRDGTIEPNTEGLGTVAKRTFAPAAKAGREPSSASAARGKVLDSVSREDAAQALVERRSAILRAMDAGWLRVGAFPFLLHRAYDILVDQVRVDGRTAVTTSLDRWAAYLADRRSVGKPTQAKSLTARFSELGDGTFGTDRAAGNGITVGVAITRPHKRRARNDPGAYGLVATFARDGRSVRVDRADAQADVLAEEVARAHEEAAAQRTRVEIIRESVGRFISAGMVREAAQLQEFAKRKWGVNLKPKTAVSLLVLLLLGGCAGVAAIGYTVYRLVTYQIQNETPDGSLPRRLREGGPPRVPADHVEARRTSARELVFSIREPEKLANALPVWEAAHLPSNIRASVEVDWMWTIRTTADAAPAHRRTDSPHLTVRTGASMDPAKMHVEVRPVRRIHWDARGPEPSVQAEVASDRLRHRTLDLDDPKTYDAFLAEEDVRDLHIEWMSDTYMILTLDHPEETVSRYRERHVGEVKGEAQPHIEWRWKVKPAYRASAVTKLTENGQLHVILDRPRAEAEPIQIECEPLHVVHGATNPVMVDRDGRLHDLGPAAIEHRHEALDKGDVLVFADPRTHEEWTQAKPPAR